MPDIIFHYHATTGELIGQSNVHFDTIDEQAMLPEHTTTAIPPDATEGKVIIYTDGAWLEITDHRGESYYDVDGNQITITQLGQTPDASWTVAPPLVLLKKHKRIEIRNAYNAALEQAIVVDDISYHGGYDSLTKLDGAKRLAETAGLTDVTFYDVNNMPHVLSIASAEIVILSIGVDVQAKLAKKQGLMNDINHADQAALDGIVW